MPLSVGARLGPYEILSALGEGGMGEVYRARDGALHRDVALKILPEAFASDPDRLARFRREAQVLAALNHPNIAAIYGFEESTAVHALVLELVEGPTLADRIAHGPIPVDEALPIATQIAEALEAAHEHGIIHRDLKPANIKVRDDGTVKVLDFGLAKLSEAGGAGRASGVGGADGHAHSRSPTITTPAMMTGVGVILGTAAYMAPEQAKGRTADKRSDVWAFGAVLFEMLTGRRAFEGEDLSDTLANVLKSEPDWNALPADVPPHIRMLIQRCLAKDRRQRMADMSVALFVMTEAASLAPAAVVTSAPTATMARPSLWRRLAIPTAAALVVGAAVGAAVWFAMRPSASRVTRFALAPTGAAALSLDTFGRDLAITPDGTRVIYKGIRGATDTRLFVRALDQLEPTPLAGLGNSGAPFASPDGQWIGFVDANAGPGLKKVAITGGPAQLLCRFDGTSRGFTWGDDGSIVFATSSLSTGLQRVSAAGGQPTVLTKPDRMRGEADHLWPQFLPGSQAVLFTITATTGGIDAAQVAVLDLRTGTQKILMRGASQAQYVPSGHLVYAVAGTLRAVAFDLPRLAPIGNSVQVVPQVATLPTTGTAEFDIARNGTLVYVPGGAGAAPVRTLVWVDRQGHEDAIKAAPPRAYTYPRLSPDGTRVAVDIRDQENDIWVWDFARENLTKVTSNPGVDRTPAWMPDGLRLVFSSEVAGAHSLFWQAADGTGTAEPLTESRNLQFPSAVSPDGTRVVFSEGTNVFTFDVMMLTLEQDRRVQPPSPSAGESGRRSTSAVRQLVHTPSGERNGEISPDGQWLAYESNISGQFQIFVAPFPDVDKQRSLVSTGTRPLWAPNSPDLFYLAPNGALMSVRVERGAAVGPPTTLIDAPYFHGDETYVSRTYDVSPDGKRFLMIKEAGGGSDQPSAPPSIVVVQNWIEELKRLVPTGK